MEEQEEEQASSNAVVDKTVTTAEKSEATGCDDALLMIHSARAWSMARDLFCECVSEGRANSRHHSMRVTLSAHGLRGTASG